MIVKSEYRLGLTKLFEIPGMFQYLTGSNAQCHDVYFSVAGTYTVPTADQLVAVLAVQGNYQRVYRDLNASDVRCIYFAKIPYRSCRVMCVRPVLIAYHQLEMIKKAKVSQVIIRFYCCCFISVSLIFAGESTTDKSSGKRFAFSIYCARTVYHIDAETKWPPFRRWHFQMHFLEWK